MITWEWLSVSRGFAKSSKTTPRGQYSFMFQISSCNSFKFSTGPDDLLNPLGFGLLESPRTYSEDLVISFAFIKRDFLLMLKLPSEVWIFGIFLNHILHLPYIIFFLVIPSRAFRSIFSFKHRCKVQLLNQESWLYTTFHMSLLQMLVSTGYFWKAY